MLNYLQVLLGSFCSQQEPQSKYRCWLTRIESQRGTKEVHEYLLEILPLSLTTSHVNLSVMGLTLLQVTSWVFLFKIPQIKKMVSCGRVFTEV